jgi:hypothetical protein
VTLTVAGNEADDELHIGFAEHRRGSTAGER